MGTELRLSGTVVTGVFTNGSSPWTWDCNGFRRQISFLFKDIPTTTWLLYARYIHGTSVSVISMPSEGPYFCFVFFKTGFVCVALAITGTYTVDQAELKLRDLHVPTS